MPDPEPMAPSHATGPALAANIERAARRRLYVRIVVSLLLLWAIAAYLLLPRLWMRHYRRHPFASEAERITTTSDGHPGDPINIQLVGTQESVIRGMLAAGWYAADPITLKSSLQIAVDSVLRRADDEAPVSDLFLFGRKQDLAFEQPVQGGPRHRHHVRFWSWNSPDGELAWYGSATYDERVGLSYTTGQVTHHIGPDIDAERDRIAAGLKDHGWAASVEWEEDFRKVREGRNGGGDPWRTDGKLAIVKLRAAEPNDAK